MKLPTLRRTRRLRIDIVPKMGGFTAERMVWWTTLLQLLTLTAAPLAVFWYAGGSREELAGWSTAALDAHGWDATLHLFAAPPVSLGLALITLFAMALVGSLADAEGRRSEHRHFHRWYASHHPEDVPGEQVALLVQAILRERGPMTSLKIRRLLGEGGPWGPAVQVSPFGLVNGVLRPKGKQAPWLAEREDASWPWSLRETPYVPPASLSSSEIVERAVLLNGPIRFHDLVGLLHRGGEHGGPLLVSVQAVAKMLRDAAWLAPREPGDLYQHADAQAEAVR